MKDNVSSFVTIEIIMIINMFLKQLLDNNKDSFTFYDFRLP